MQQIVSFVSIDKYGIITRETWQVTPYHCPRCGSGAPHVWVLTSVPPLKAGLYEFRVFLCVGCKHTAFGLNGFNPGWDRADRAKQILTESGLLVGNQSK